MTTSASHYYARTHTGDETCPICYGPRIGVAGVPLPAIQCYAAEAEPLDWAEQPAPVGTILVGILAAFAIGFSAGMALVAAWAGAL